MSAVSHYLETEGIPTVAISLVREHAAQMRPPRALWVPFMFGRPLGAPNDAGFQREVLRAALALLERDDVPVLEDFSRDAPAERGEQGAAGPHTAVEDEPLACPVAFTRLMPVGDTRAALEAALLEEVAQLSPWHALGARRRGGSTAALGGQPPVAAAGFLVSMLGTEVPVTAPDGGDLAQALKLACDDLRAFYEEAAIAQPGRLSSDAIGEWYYRQTIVGDVLERVRGRLLASVDPALLLLGEKMLIPRKWAR